MKMCWRPRTCSVVAAAWSTSISTPRPHQGKRSRKGWRRIRLGDLPVIAPGHLALATVTFLLGDLAAWIGLIAGEPNRRRDQITIALVGLLVTGLMGFIWFTSRSSGAMMDRWLRVSMMVLALIAFCGLVIAILRMRVRLKQRG